jgi:putative transcription factor
MPTHARPRSRCAAALLPQMVNEKPQIIQEYESGKAIPNPQVLSKMSRVLGVTLKRNPK